MKAKFNLQPLTRFIEHLPSNGDPELALLKCHLLVEELLTKFIERHLKHAEHLDKARLSFSQKVHFARALNDLEDIGWAWNSVKKLNLARNQMAHGLSKEELQKRLNAFIASVEATEGVPEPELVSGPLGRFQWAAFKVFAALAVRAHLDLSSLQIRGTASSLLQDDAEQAVQANGPASGGSAA